MINIKKISSKASYYIWLLNSYIAGKQSSDTQNKAVAILASYHIERMKNIEPLVRSILKCDFIKKIILSNHNPNVLIEDWVKIKDDRLNMINQPTRRGPGYCWDLAKKEDSQFFILIDDDFLVSPKQIKILFQRLLDNSDIPHGVTGHNNLEYYQNIDMEVDILNQIYAITKTHLNKYFEIAEAINAIDHEAYETIEPYAHEIIISKTGKNRPRIHNIGLLTRCPTARKPSVAIHQSEDFRIKRVKVFNALQTVMQNTCSDKMP